MSRFLPRQRFLRAAVGAFLASCALLASMTGCSTSESGMMAITVDSDGHPVGLAVGCRYELRTGHLQRWVAPAAGSSEAAPTTSPQPALVDQGEIASWALPAATQEIVAWNLDAQGTVNDVRPLTAPPVLHPGDAYRLVGTSTAGAAHVVQFTLGELRHIQPGQAIVRDRGGEPRTVDLNQLVDIACTDAGLSPTKSPEPNGATQDH
jgi:hypothetical protein